MGVVIVFTLLLFCVVFWTRQYKGTFISIYSSLWLLVFVLYESGRYNLYSVRFSTYMLYFVGLLTFYMSYIISSGIKRRRIDHKISNKTLNFRFFFIVLSIVSIIVLSLKSIRAIPLWLVGGEGEVKSTLLTSDYMSLGTLGDGLYLYVARPMQQVLLIYVVMLFATKKRDTLIVLLTIFISLLYFITSAAKFTILSFLVLFIAYIIFFSRGSLFKYLKNNKKTAALLLLVGVFIYYLMSLSGNFGLSLYVYLCGCIPCSDIAMETVSTYSYAYGAVSFNGILTLLKFPCEILGIFPDLGDMAYDYYYSMMRFEETVEIGNGINYNAFISMFPYFYADGGYIGVVLLSALFGFICQIIDFNAFHKPTYRDIAFLLFITSAITETLVRFPLFFVSYFMTIIYLVVFIPSYRVPLLGEKEGDKGC